MGDEADLYGRWSASRAFDLGVELDPEPADALDPVHEWRAEQLERLGISPLAAQIFADLVDWHRIAKLVRSGCPPALALEIVA